jgi:hypothetical protein
MAPAWLIIALSPSALALQLGPMGSALRAAAPALARAAGSIRMDATPPDDWDAAWKNFSRGGKASAESTPAAEVKEPADEPFWLAPPSRPPASEDDESGGTFRLAPPLRERPGDANRGRGQEALLSAFASEKGLLVGVGVLGLILCFYIYIALSGGITDGSDRFVNPEPLAETMARDPEYEPPVRTWSPAAPLVYTE